MRKRYPVKRFHNVTLPSHLSLAPIPFPCSASGKKALSLVEAAPGDIPKGEDGGAIVPAAAGGARGEIGATELSYYCGPHDLKRLELYSRNLVGFVC